MFITVEGVEGSGKSTLLKALAAVLEAQNIPCLVTREPGGSKLGQELRPLLLRTKSNMDARAELFLFLADRAQHIREVIRPALDNGTWVLCDRYADSTLAYQGYGRGMNLELLEQCNHAATDGLWPDCTFLLDLPVDEGLKRALTRNRDIGISQSEGRFEAEALAFHQRVREGFLARAARWPQRFAVLDARQSPEDLLKQALTHLEKTVPGIR